MSEIDRLGGFVSGTQAARAILADAMTDDARRLEATASHAETMHQDAEAALHLWAGDEAHRELANDIRRVINAIDELRQALVREAR